MDNTPKFCRICGSRLEESAVTNGYDEFTGEPEKFTTLFCSNVTTVKKGFSTSVTTHPSWANNDGIWTQT